MKKIQSMGICIVAGLAAMSSINVGAQSGDKWNGSIEFDPIFSTTEGVDAGFNFKVAATRKVYDYLSVGFGAGVSETFKFSGLPTIPVFARLHAEDYSREFSPFVRFDAGYGLNIDDFDYSGIVINPTVGIRYRAFTLGIGYYGAKPMSEGSKMSNSINISLGYNFGYHRSNSAVANFLRKFDLTFDLGALIPLGGRSSGKYEEDVTPDIHSSAEYNDKYTLGGAATLSILYPVTKNFYAGIMGGFNLTNTKFNYKNAVDYADEYRDDYMYEHNSSQAWWAIPIGLRLKYKFREISVADKFYPFAQLDMGTNIVNVEDDNGENAKKFYFSPTVGLSLDVWNGFHSLDLGLSYVPMYIGCDEYIGGERIDKSYQVQVNTDYKTKTIGAFKISLGYTF